eukprot:12918169-Alexandrium_andersonii.AAC.1
MSASLVGSEMCIRDRASPEPAPESASSKCDCAAGLLEVALPPRPNAQPVSYTHLTLPTICSV